MLKKLYWIVAIVEWTILLIAGWTILVDLNNAIIEDDLDRDKQ